MKQALLLLAIGLPLFAGLAWATSLPQSQGNFPAPIPDGIWPMQKQPFLLQVYCDPTPIIEPSYEPYPLAAESAGVESGIARGAPSVTMPEEAKTVVASGMSNDNVAYPLPGWYPRRDGFRFSLRYQCVASPAPQPLTG